MLALIKDWKVLTNKVRKGKRGSGLFFNNAEKMDDEVTLKLICRQYLSLVLPHRALVIFGKLSRLCKLKIACVGPV